MSNIEEYRDIPGYEGLYQVSNLGNVKSLDRVILRKNGNTKNWKGRVMKQTSVGIGYLGVQLCKNDTVKKFLVHVLVMMAFRNHVSDGQRHKKVVDHIDNNRTNNILSNLQVITNRLNTSKDRKGYSSKYIGVSYCKDVDKWIASFQDGKKLINLGRYKSEIEASIVYQNKLKEYGR